jgi:hypothetical protein
VAVVKVQVRVGANANRLNNVSHSSPHWYSSTRGHFSAEAT